MTTALRRPSTTSADPHDPGLFPTLSGEQLAVVAERGQRRRFTSGQLLFEHGQRDAPFFVLECGAVDFLGRRHDGDRYFARALPGTFIGHVAILTGEATVAPLWPLVRSASSSSIRPTCARPGGCRCGGRSARRSGAA